MSGRQTSGMHARPSHRYASATASVLLVVSAAAGLSAAGPGTAAAATDATGTVGAVWTVGAGPNGQLGNGTTGNRAAFGTVSNLGATISQVSGGREHVLALDTSGHVWAWGDGPMGQIGNGSMADRTTPTQVPGISTAVQVAAGHYHSMALLADGTARAWGYNSFGQLGDGSTTNRSSPVTVSGLSNLVELAGGRDLSLGLRSDGTVWAWGLDTDGELGDGGSANRSRPVQVSGLTSVVHVAAGRDHGLAVKSDGTVWTWGLNTSGQLGDGTKVARHTPVKVIGIGTAVDVASGADDSLALLANGQVMAWGENGRGQLGNGKTTDAPTPAVVAGLPPVAHIDSGRDHSLAVTTSGQLWDWGFDDAGQLGDGKTANRLSPQQIPGISDAIEASGGRNYSVLLRGSSGPPDTTPPTVPGQPSGSSTTAGQVDLSWAAATDDQATTITYRVFRDGGGSAVGSVSSSSTGTVSWSDTGLVAGSVHTYTVTASDGTNTSAPSPASDPVTVASGGSSTLFTDGFDGGLGAWTTVGPVSLDSARAAPTGTAPSVRTAPANQAADLIRTLSAGEPRVCTTVDVLVGALPPSGTTLNLIRVRTSANAFIARVYVTSAGKLSVRSDAGAATFTTSAGLTVGTWASVQLCVTTGATGGMSLALNGSTVKAWTTSTGSTPIDQVQLGDDGARTAVVNYDDVVATR